MKSSRKSNPVGGLHNKRSSSVTPSIQDIISKIAHSKNDDVLFKNLADSAIGSVSSASSQNRSNFSKFSRQSNRLKQPSKTFYVEKPNERTMLDLPKATHGSHPPSSGARSPARSPARSKGNGGGYSNRSSRRGDRSHRSKRKKKKDSQQSFANSFIQAHAQAEVPHEKTEEEIEAEAKKEREKVIRQEYYISDEDEKNCEVKSQSIQGKKFRVINRSFSPSKNPSKNEMMSKIRRKISRRMSLFMGMVFKNQQKATLGVPNLLNKNESRAASLSRKRSYDPKQSQSPSRHSSIKTFEGYSISKAHPHRDQSIHVKNMDKSSREQSRSSKKSSARMRSKISSRSMSSKAKALENKPKVVYFDKSIEEEPTSPSPLRAKRRQTLKNLMAKLRVLKHGDTILMQENSSDEEGQPIYSLQSTLKGGGFMKELYLKLYEKAKKMNYFWMWEKHKNEERFTTLKELQFRLTDGLAVDLGESPHIRHIHECMEIIEEMEASKKGTTDEKMLSQQEKFKLSLIYMQMIDEPHKFKQLESILQIQDSNKEKKEGLRKNQLRMNLPENDLMQYNQLQETIQKNNLRKEILKEQRKKILEESKRRSIQAPPKIKSKLSRENQDEISLKKLLVKSNPMMAGQPSKVNFPPESKSPSSTKHAYIKAMLAQENRGWNFIDDIDESLSVLENPTKLPASTSRDIMIQIQNAGNRKSILNNEIAILNMRSGDLNTSNSMDLTQEEGIAMEEDPQQNETADPDQRSTVPPLVNGSLEKVLKTAKNSKKDTSRIVAELSGGNPQQNLMFAVANKFNKKNTNKIQIRDQLEDIDGSPKKEEMKLNEASHFDPGQSFDQTAVQIDTGILHSLQSSQSDSRDPGMFAQSNHTLQPKLFKGIFHQSRPSNLNFSNISLAKRHMKKTSTFLKTNTSGFTINSSSVATRSPYNQRTIDFLPEGTSKKTKLELSQIGKDIYDNVLEYRKHPGPMNSENIEKALKTHIWKSNVPSEPLSPTAEFLSKPDGTPDSEIKDWRERITAFQRKKWSEQPQRSKPMKIDHVVKAEQGFADMAIKLNKLDENKRMNRVSVREQSQRINQILVVKRRRYEYL